MPSKIKKIFKFFEFFFSFIYYTCITHKVGMTGVELILIMKNILIFSSDFLRNANVHQTKLNYFCL